MTRLIVALTRADLRAAPERAVTVAVLLAVAALMAPLLSLDPVIGVVLSVGVAGAAAAGATAQHRRRHEILVLNGADLGLELRLAAAAMVVPGLMATALAGIVGALWSESSHATAALALALLVPVVTAPLVTLLWSPLSPSRRHTVSLVIVVVLLAPTVIVPLGALASLVGRRLARASVVGRVAGSVLAAGVAGGAAVVAGKSETWLDLSIALALVAVPLGLAVAWLGSSALGGAGWLARRAGPLARLAVAPLSERRGALAPVVAIVALVTSLAVLEAVMGASFGEREADRDRDGAVMGTVGLQPDQAIVVTTVDLPASQVRDLAEGAARDAEVQVAVIERLGTGGTQVDGFHQPRSPFLPNLRLEIPPTWRLAGTSPPSPSWIGVATPEDLALLGLGTAADALARGQVVVLAPGGVDQGRALLRGPGRGYHVPAVVARPSERPALRLPGALISPARAAGLGAEVRSARAVFVPGEEPVADTSLVGVASRLRDTLQLLAPGGSEEGSASSPYGSQDQAGIVAIEAGRPVGLGDEEVRSEPGGELNHLPYLSGTWEAGRGQAVALGALALLVALAGTVLALGGTRADDAVLDAQGASTRTRVTMAAVQAAVLTGTAAAVGGAVGIGLPALGFGDYNARPRTSPATDIPLVVPWELLVGLAVLPVLAAALAAVVTALRPTRSTSAFDDLAW